VLAPAPALQEANLTCGLFKENVLCFGDLDDIQQAFKGRMLSEATIRDISSEALLRLNSVELGLIYEIINRSLVADFNLICKSWKQRTFYSPEHPVATSELSQRKIFDRALQNKIFEAFSYEIEFIGGKAYLLVNPEVHIELDDSEKIKDLQNRILECGRRSEHVQPEELT